MQTLARCHKPPVSGPAWHRWALLLSLWVCLVGPALPLAGAELPDDALPVAQIPGNANFGRDVRASIAEDWLLAVASGRQGLAMRSAARLVDANYSVPVDPYYREIAQQRGLLPGFFTAPFSRWDYQSWRQAYLIQQMARNAPRGTLPEVTAIFNLVCQTVAPEERVKLNANSPWPYWILKRGWGVCDRMSWALAELVYQCGYETQMVYLFDSQQRESGHTILEIRSPAGKVWVADALSGILVPDYSVDRLVRDDAKLEEIWPGNANWHDQLRHSVLFTPSFPQDYCWRNQELALALRPLLGPRCPRFGEDPRQRTVAYRQLRQKELGDKLLFSMALWSYPFQLLRNDISNEAQGL
jgi:hypothetical protein